MGFTYIVSILQPIIVRLLSHLSWLLELWTARRPAHNSIAPTEQITTVRVIDWTDPAANDFFLASQFWIAGDMYKRRADLIGFVNGLPLVFVELKAAHRHLKDAYDHNLRDYRDTIPSFSGTTPPSSSPTVSRPASAPSPPPGPISPRGSRSTWQAPPARSRSTR